MDVNDDENVKLLNPKDTIINNENINSENILEKNVEQIINDQKINDHYNTDNNLSGTLQPCTERRSDEPTELNFEKGKFIIENPKKKKQKHNF